MSRSGTFQNTMAGYRAFLPNPLPPNPLFNLGSDLQLLLSEADRALGALNVVVTVLPSPDLLVGLFIQKEALLSSQIEGTQSSLVDVLGASEEHIPTADVGEVINYVKAMRHGLKRLKKDDFPMSLRLLREIHGVLMQQVRGGATHLTPGEFRTMQNWIGGTNPNNARFVPPPPAEMQLALNSFECYLHEGDDLPPLIRCALIHYQFETIHPFNDGNGRVGRLLITLYLVWKGILDEPMLYLSAYLKTHQQEYYDRLTQVRTDGNYEAWTRFFLEGVRDVSEMVLETTKRIQALERADSDRLVAAGEGSHGLTLLRSLMKQPVVMANDVASLIDVSYNKANALLANCERLGIVRQINQGRRNRRFMYQAYVDILAEGTELG
ncbi:MAG: Fic family protein [Desulfuromonas sp.]|nr:Fic family protein [Desulfuromonas sp.]